MSAKVGVSKWLSAIVGPDRMFSWHFTEGMKQYQHGDAGSSIRHFQECLEIYPQWFVQVQMSVVYSQLLGDMEEALRLLRYARRCREQSCTPPEGKPPYRFLWPFWAAQIGHIANLEHLIKRELLLNRDPKNLILDLPDSRKPANQALLEKISKYITIAKQDADLPHPRQAMLSVLEEYFICDSLDGLTKHWWHASSEILREWEAAGRAPLLGLTEAELEKGRDCLRNLGVPDAAWFVCLHVREGGFKRAQGFATIEQALNADVDAYHAAIAAVTERGGWVVRIGDKMMKRLSPMRGVIDYAHSPLRSDWMDVFLMGACRFFMGTSSGPAYVPPLFGIPCVLTNWSPAGQRPFNRRDIYIPKLYVAGKPSRQLRFAEMMAPPVGYAPGYVYAKQLGLVAVPNTPEEIREVVSEMLDRLDGCLSYTDTDEALQAAFDVVAETNLCIGGARAGRDFLRRHRNLLREVQGGL